jgi:hypothetical protein
LISSEKGAETVKYLKKSVCAIQSSERRKQTMKFMMRAARPAVLLALAFALAPPAFTQINSTKSSAQLSDSQEPGSVIVFPKFVQGTVALPEGGTAPITTLEIGVVCPEGVNCLAHQAVTIRFHWVCGATGAASTVCQETDFDVNATVFEKIILTPNGEPTNAYASGLPTKTVPAAGCPNGGGYLIGWVINTLGQPIKFDGLIGEAHLRPGSTATATIAGSPTALASYNAIPIQADSKLANGATIKLNSDGGLIFDGGAGHYRAVTGQVMGDVRYTNLTTGPTFTLGVLTLLTLDVKANRPNNPVFVDLDFFGGNPSGIGNENELSTFTSFVCWEEVPITAINSNLTTGLMGREGVFVSDSATKVALIGISDDTGPVSLLGLAETLEGGVFPPTAPWPRASFTKLFNNSVPTAAHFVP